MAQNVTVAGASYSDVPALNLPKTGGGTSVFTDVTDTTATASDVASGKYFYTAAGVRTEGTSSGGGGAISVVDTPDVHGGTIRTITAVDISDTTAVAADVAAGKYFYTAAGVRTEGTAHVLPSTYQKVEYLGVTQNCYITLGARSYASFGYEVTFYIISRYHQSGPHLISDNTEYLWFIPRQNNTLTKWGGTETQVSKIFPLNIKNYACFNLDGTELIELAGLASQTLTKGGNSYGNVCLFAWGGGKTTTNYHFNGFLYNLRFYNNSEVVEDFVPCYRKADSVPGLYDVVNHIFYTNSGSGSFTVGRDIS